ncbi:hypothetical protein KWH10_21745 [Xanthomonas campestris pv. clerodendri]|uniref:hypothetical protein n=1 Tax=Xanthomonas euvesicatoria TaxID=456327 RepID=UPI001C4814AB|nr:hypothetical protein [Xanthomonas euvesicatoria]MBV6791806.1 hypothetical protein [Xanthomonas campestris pv. clerodendri]
MDFIAFSLIAGACCLWLWIGTLRLVSWILERRDAAILRQFREQDLIARAAAEVRNA